MKQLKALIESGKGKYMNSDELQVLGTEKKPRKRRNVMGTGD